MRKVMLALALTAAGLGLLLSFKSRPATGASALGGSALSGAGASGSRTSSSNTAATSSSAGAGGAKGGSAFRNGDFTGAAERTAYGPVQVQAIVSGGRLTDVAVLEVPDRGGYENQLVQVAVPELRSEALSAQSANIDIVSGATYTSQGYAQSLQSALDQAGL